jgi:hypothetical protein
MRWIAYLILLIGCSSPLPSSRWEEIEDRTGLPLYRVAVPIDWKRIDPTGPIDDSRLPNVTFEVDGVTIAIHTFDHPIPPQAQIERWIKQAGGGSALHTSFGGYVGLRFEAERVVAWAMERPASSSGVYTIKATGNVASHRHEIDRFARSFGHIQEIP